MSKQRTLEIIEHKIYFNQWTDCNWQLLWERSSRSIWNYSTFVQTEILRIKNLIMNFGQKQLSSEKNKGSIFKLGIILSSFWGKSNAVQKDIRLISTCVQVLKEILVIYRSSLFLLTLKLGTLEVKYLYNLTLASVES